VALNTVGKDYEVPVRGQPKPLAFSTVLRIRRIRMFFGLPEPHPDPLVIDMDPDPDQAKIVTKTLIPTGL
jgi:hypothetical protein